MRTAIDGAGRIVIPKRIRELAGLTEGAAVDIEFNGVSVVLTVPSTEVGVIVEHDGRVATSLDEDDPGPFADLDELLSAIHSQRR